MKEKKKELYYYAINFSIFSENDYWYLKLYKMRIWIIFLDIIFIAHINK
jgi:hypothetical protein